MLLVPGKKVDFTGVETIDYNITFWLAPFLFQQNLQLPAFSLLDCRWCRPLNQSAFMQIYIYTRVEHIFN